ncbi:hypothetical protein EI555_012040 [Monodon monoceros]|uniref:39S ribosomal protein L52, mitochondrial n=1 Tax=Monodon monoceros TaxID=40151 RepID=A0A4U1EAK9_MONMO|nr:hypothetical protein EI555_012040 [Monodon monoceros]
MAALRLLLSSGWRLHCGVTGLVSSLWALLLTPLATGSLRSSQTGLTGMASSNERPASKKRPKEMDAGLQAWQLRQQKLQEEERKQQNALKPKGARLQNPRPGQ